MACSKNSGNYNPPINDPQGKVTSDKLICKFGYIPLSRTGPMLGEQTQSMDLEYDRFKATSPIRIFTFEDELSTVYVSILAENTNMKSSDPSSNEGKSVTFEIQHKNKSNKATEYPESVMLSRTKMGWNLFNIFLGAQTFGNSPVDTASVSCGFFNK